jgi:23S rRNA pseudouridine1911/1915/1917 synthase
VARLSEPATRFTVGRGDVGKRLDQFLHERIPGLSRTRIQQAIRERVSLSWGVRPRPSTPVRAGGEVQIERRLPVEKPLDLEIEILQTAEGWLAVNKPPNVPVHPVNRVLENSLIRILRRQEADEGLRLVHRLDSETTGVLLVSRDVPTSRALSTAFMKGEVDKEYLALVAGVVDRDEGKIDLAIGPARDSRIYLRLEAGHGKPALTRWRVEHRFDNRTLVRLFPTTGRRHQLRVHMASIGHPILGDILYGRPDEDYLNMVRGAGDVRKDGPGPTRQLLHCARLGFADPSSGTRLAIEAPVPADFLAHIDPVVGLDPHRSDG